MSDAPPPVHPGTAAGGDGPLTPDRVDALLADFRGWLLAGGEPAPGPADLAAVVREFTALRHEVHLQTKATRAAVERLGEPADPKAAQRPLVEALIDVAEALRIGLRQTLDADQELRFFVPDDPPPDPARYPRPSWWERLRGASASAAYSEASAQWQQRRRKLSALTECVNPVLAGVSNGYAMSLRRLDRALAAAGVEPFGEVGQRFDPETMEAVELDTRSGRAEGKPDGEVVRVHRRGYRWHGEVFRFAQVTVAR